MPEGWAYVPVVAGLLRPDLRGEWGRRYVRRREDRERVPADRTERGSYPVEREIFPHGFPHGTLRGQVSPSLSQLCRPIATHPDTMKGGKSHRETAARGPVWGEVAGQGT